MTSNQIIGSGESKVIEDGFPFEAISIVAQHESWRKEIYRPLTYLHKWWAKRLGSVFRAIIIASAEVEGRDVEPLFYSPVRYPNLVVYDPFMGSGTTIVEAIKLGCRAIGRDINPVPVNMISASLQKYSLDEIVETYKELERTAGERVKNLYRANLDDGTEVDVLYYFWVKQINCPRCDHLIDLFKSYIFSSHAYPKKYPESKALCPKCGAINDVQYTDESVICPSCRLEYNPQKGPVQSNRVTCPSCTNSFKIIDVMRKCDKPPEHRMYAKIVLDDKIKRYLPITPEDEARYVETKQMLDGLGDYIPDSAIASGHNTDQVLNYNYHYWKEMFNDRQLASLAILAKEISKLGNPKMRNLFGILFSGSLEFNNMFASFKGEGTGAVRHMFYNHILKPEMTPIEANVWGTDRSSGSFSTLYESRILRAMEYKAKPFEISVPIKGGKGNKVYGLSAPIETIPANSYADFERGKRAYLSVGDSAETDIASQSVDLVITDPPFFDNVHYSELADFFHVWQRKVLCPTSETTVESTRSINEVQSTDANDFSKKLRGVFLECRRVLKDDGLLVFTYHHSRVDGWSSVYEAVREASFTITNTQPVKAEMSVSVPVRSSRVPINYDLIIVCRKEGNITLELDEDIILKESITEMQSKVVRLKDANLDISLGDAWIIAVGALLSRLSSINDIANERKYLDHLLEQIYPMVRASYSKATTCASIE